MKSLSLLPIHSLAGRKAKWHSELSRDEMQHLSAVCPFAAIGTKELTGEFSRKTKQYGYSVAFSSGHKKQNPGAIQGLTLSDSVVGEAALEKAGERRVHASPYLLIRGDRVDCCRGDGFVPERGLHGSYVDVGRDEGKAERMFQAVRVPPISWQARAFRDGLEHAEELRAMNSPALLRREHEIARVTALDKPGSKHALLG